MTYPSKLFQIATEQRLRKMYRPFNIPVELEWTALKGIRGVYSPRIDIAIGPFSTIGDVRREQDYDELLKFSKKLIADLIRSHNTNVRAYWPKDVSALSLRCFDDFRNHNRNARCFLAIEIENRVSRKHLLGGAVNSSTLGRVAVVVGFNEEKVKALIRLAAYWEFLSHVGKKTWRGTNLLIVNCKQLSRALSMGSRLR